MFAICNLNRINVSSISPITNGLSHHGAQILTIKNGYATIRKFPLKQRIRLIDNETIMNCQTVLKKEIRESVYIQGVPGGMCNTSGECSLC